MADEKKPRKIGFCAWLGGLLECIVDLQFWCAVNFRKRVVFFCNFQNLRGHGHFKLRFPIKREIGENVQMFLFFGAQ